MSLRAKRSNLEVLPDCFALLAMTWAVLVLPLAGCGLLELPLALVGAVFSIVQIPVNLALSLIGPATNAAATAAPYALLLAKMDGNEKEWDLVLFQNETGKSRHALMQDVARFSANREVAPAYPYDSEALKKYVLARNTRCFLIRV